MNHIIENLREQSHKLPAIFFQDSPVPFIPPADGFSEIQFDLITDWYCATALRYCPKTPDLIAAIFRSIAANLACQVRLRTCGGEIMSKDGSDIYGTCELEVKDDCQFRFHFKSLLKTKMIE